MFSVTLISAGGRGQIAGIPLVFETFDSVEDARDFAGQCEGSMAFAIIRDETTDETVEELFSAPSKLETLKAQAADEARRIEALRVKCEARGDHDQPCVWENGQIAADRRLDDLLDQIDELE